MRGAVDLAPADDKIIKIRHTLSIDPRGQLLASIIGKKKSVCATHILMDIPLGKGTKIQTYRDAQILRHQFLSLTRRLKMKCKVIVTDGKEPIGNGIGPALEARDVLWVLENDSRMPSDLKEKSIMMAGLMLRMAGKAKPWNANAMAREILESGKAYEKYMEIVEAQGGKRINSEQIKLSRNSLEIISYKDGVVKQIDNLAIAKIARIAGAPEEKESGLYLWKHVNSKVRTGDKLVTLYAENKEKLKFALEIYREMNPFVIE